MRSLKDFSVYIRTNNITNGINRLYQYCLDHDDPYVWSTMYVQGKTYYVVCDGWHEGCLANFANLEEAHRSSLQQFKRVNLKHKATIWRTFPGHQDGISIDIFER